MNPSNFAYRVMIYGNTISIRLTWRLIRMIFPVRCRLRCRLSDNWPMSGWLVPLNFNEVSENLCVFIWLVEAFDAFCPIHWDVFSQSSKNRFRDAIANAKLQNIQLQLEIHAVYRGNPCEIYVESIWSKLMTVRSVKLEECKGQRDKNGKLVVPATTSPSHHLFFRWEQGVRCPMLRCTVNLALFSVHWCLFQSDTYHIVITFKISGSSNLFHAFSMWNRQVTMALQLFFVRYPQHNVPSS